MSDKTLSIMNEQLIIVEKYISDLDAAADKQEMMKAINTCSESIKKQYDDLEEIAEDFCSRVKTDKELSAVSDRIGNLLSKEVTKFYGKMGQFMADPDFMETFSNFDIVVGNNPLFGVNQFGGDVAANVSHAMAGGMDDLAMKMMADSTEIDTDVEESIAAVMNDFLALSKRYVDRMREATTSRKAVTATDSFVSAIKRQIPEMKKHSDQFKLIMRKPVQPKAITEAAEELKKTLGDDLKEVMKDKNEILQEQKVQKAVSKLGAILNEVPF